MHLRKMVRIGLAVIFSAGGLSRLTPARDDLIAMVPPGIPKPALVVDVCGVLELTVGLALLVPRWSRRAGIGLTALLIAVFPANIHGARNRIPIAGHPHPPLIPRGIVQLVLIALCLWATNHER